MKFLSRTFEAVTDIRNRVFDRGWLKVEKSKVPVVSIGNISVGGTGKTPITAYLTQKCVERGLRVAIVSRGYGGQIWKPSLVKDEAGAASRYGDEPTWYVRTLAGVRVAVGSRRIEACRLVENDVDIILADDAFQHRWLHRDINIVVLDMSQPLSAWQLLPTGRLREALEHLGRATDIFWSKSNFVSTEQRQQILDLVAPHIKTDRILEWKHHIKMFRDANGNAIDLTAGKMPVILVSGIADPVGFERLIREHGALDVKMHQKFPDHYKYKEIDIRDIQERAVSIGAKFIVTTEKDFVKLKDVWTGDMVKLVTTSLEVYPTDLKIFEEWFNAALNRMGL